MAEHDPLDELRDFTEDAERLVETPMPAAWVRHRGAQRRRRRITAVVVAAFVALVVSGGGVYSAIVTRPELPSPAQTPGISTTPTPTPAAPTLGRPTPAPTIGPSSRPSTFVPDRPATRTPAPTLRPSSMPSVTGSVPETPTPSSPPTPLPTPTPGDGTEPTAPEGEPSPSILPPTAEPT